MTLIHTTNLHFFSSVINDGTFINNEYNDVYLVTTVDPIPLEAFTLQVECDFVVLLFSDLLNSAYNTIK